MPYKKRYINCFSCIICFLVHELFEQEFLNLLAADWLEHLQELPKKLSLKTDFRGNPEKY
jgi:hypothetical protein